MGEDLFLRTERNFKERTGRTQGIKFKISPPKKALPRRVKKDKKDSSGAESGSGNSTEAFSRRVFRRGASEVGVKGPGEMANKRSLVRGTHCVSLQATSFNVVFRRAS